MRTCHGITQLRGFKQILRSSQFQSFLDEHPEAQRRWNVLRPILDGILTIEQAARTFTVSERTIFDVLGPGSLFGNFLPNAEGATHYAEALPGSRICTLSPEDFQKVIAAHPEVLVRLLKKLSARLHDYEQKLRLDMSTAKAAM